MSTSVGSRFDGSNAPLKRSSDSAPRDSWRKSSDSDDVSPSVSPAEQRFEGEGGHTRTRFDHTRRRSTGSSTTEMEDAGNAKLLAQRRRSDISQAVGEPGAKQPLPGVSYAAVIKADSVPVPESVLAEQAKEAMMLAQQLEREQAMLIEREALIAQEQLAAAPTQTLGEKAVLVTEVTTVVLPRDNVPRHQEEDDENNHSESEDNSAGDSTGAAITEQASSVIQSGKSTIANALTSVKQAIPSWLGGASAEQHEDQDESEESMLDSAKAQVSEKSAQASEKAAQLQSSAKQALEQGKNKANKLASQGGAQARNAKETVASTLQQGKKRASELASDASDKSAELQETASAKASELQETASAKASELQDAASAKLEQSKRSAGALVGDVSDKLTQWKDLAVQQWQSGKSAIAERSEQLQSAAADTWQSTKGKAADLQSTAADKASQLTSKAAPRPSKQRSAGARQRDASSKLSDKQQDIKRKADEAMVQGRGKLDSVLASARDMANQAGAQLRTLGDQASSAASDVRSMDTEQLQRSAQRTARRAQDAMQPMLEQVDAMLPPELKERSLTLLEQGKSMALDYVQSFRTFALALHKRGGELELMMGVMAVWHIAIPLLLIDYPQARMAFKWYSLVALVSHAAWYMTGSFKLMQWPQLGLAGLVSYLWLASPLLGEGLQIGTASSETSWWQLLMLPLQARSYLFSLWLRSLLMLDTAVLTYCGVEGARYMRQHGNNVQEALRSFFASDELEELEHINRFGPMIKKQRDSIKGGDKETTTTSRRSHQRRPQHAEDSERSNSHEREIEYEQHRERRTGNDSGDELAETVNRTVQKGKRVAKQALNAGKQKASELSEQADSKTRQFADKAKKATKSAKKTLHDEFDEDAEDSEQLVSQLKDSASRMMDNIRTKSRSAIKSGTEQLKKAQEPEHDDEHDSDVDEDDYYDDMVSDDALRQFDDVVAELKKGEVHLHHVSPPRERDVHHMSSVGQKKKHARRASDLDADKGANEWSAKKMELSSERPFDFSSQRKEETDESAGLNAIKTDLADELQSMMRSART